MSDYDNTNTGILSRNDKREEGSKQPEFTGKINVGGTDYWLAAWVRERKDGTGKFFSLKVTEIEDKPKPAPSKNKGMEDMDSDIPF